MFIIIAISFDSFDPVEKDPYTVHIQADEKEVNPSNSRQCAEFVAKTKGIPVSDIDELYIVEASSGQVKHYKLDIFEWETEKENALRISGN
jgi:hypothetical protein